MADKKGAIELSINTLVIIIISLVILAGGITLIYNFIGGAGSIKGTLDQRTESELERLLVNQGEKVALPLHVAEVYRGESHVFGIGILNVKGKSEQFKIEAGIKKVVDEIDKDITSSVNKQNINKWLLYNTDPITIADGDHHKEPIEVNVPEESVPGQYIFSAVVKTALGESYGNPQLFYVNVK